VPRRAPETGLWLKRVDCALEQLMYEFSEGTGVEAQRLVILVPGMPPSAYRHTKASGSRSIRRNDVADWTSVID
jgi:hypothetical protein